MNYYIQGDPARADKIKAAFEELGYDVSGFDMGNDNILFFTYKLQGGGKVISTTNAHLYTSNIIKTHPDYKELELPVEPKFKVGDKALDDMMIVTVKDVVYDQKYKEYRYSVGSYWVFESALKPYKSHYDIANFYAGMPVLARDKDNRKWCYLLYSHYDNTHEDGLCFNAGSVEWRQCIPFEGNEHLLGTTDMPSEEFINW